MLIHYGYHIQIECAAPTPLIAKLDIHPTERHRIVVARGRDAADVAIITSFGLHQLSRFEVVTEEFTDPALERAMA